MTSSGRGMKPQGPRNLTYEQIRELMATDLHGEIDVL